MAALSVASQEPAAGVLQRLGGQAIGALAHCGQAEIGAVRDQGGEQGAMRVVAAARRVTTERLERAGEAAPLVHVLEQVFDAHPRHAGADRVAQAPQLPRHRHGIGLLELDAAVLEFGEAVARQTGRRGLRRLVERGGDAIEKDARVGRQVELAVRFVPMLLPAALVMDQVPERNVIAAAAQEQIAGRTASARAMSQMRRSTLPSSIRNGRQAAGTKSTGSSGMSAARSPASRARASSIARSSAALPDAA